MRFVLDTDTCSYLLKRSHPVLVHRVRRFAPGELQVSTITVAELWYGAQRLSRAERWMPVIDRFLQNLEVLPLDLPAARESGRIRAEFAATGSPIGGYDLLIAGQVRWLGHTLVTNNEREFRRVEGLLVENWAA